MTAGPSAIAAISLIKPPMAGVATLTGSAVATWLQSLARELHRELGGPGVGAVGMCLTGGYALAMLADAPVAAPVLAQPASPAPVGKARRADLGLSQRDLVSVREKVKAGCQVLGLRYEDDPAVGTRFDTLRRELGDNFIAVEFPGRKHATLTEHRQQAGVDRVLAFFEEKLKNDRPRTLIAQRANAADLFDTDAAV